MPRMRRRSNVRRRRVPLYRRRRSYRRSSPLVARGGQLGSYVRQFRPITAETTQAYGHTWRSATPEQRAARAANRYRGWGDYTSTWNNYRGYIPRIAGANLLAILY